MSAGFTPNKKYSRHGTTLPAGYAASQEAKIASMAPRESPSLDSAVKPKVSAKARWADLQSRVVQRSSVKVQLRRQRLRSQDIWTRIGENEKTRIQLGQDSSSEDDEDNSIGGLSKTRKGMHIWVHVHDKNYPEALADHVTRFAVNTPSQTFSFPIGKGNQDFRWLAIGCMRRFTSVYRPKGRIRHREWYIGPGDVNLQAKRLFMDKCDSTVSKAQKEATAILQKTLEERRKIADEHGINMTRYGALGIQKQGGSTARKGLKAMTENTKLIDALMDGDHVWIQFQNGNASSLLAGGSETEMSCVEMFRRTRMTDGLEIAPKLPQLREKSVPKKEIKTFALEKSVFASRAKNADSGSFYDTKEYYDRVCMADIAYCPRVVDLVGGKAGYTRVVKLLCENYRHIREAFRFHVAQSNAGNFEMSWLDFSSFAKYCKLIESHGEHKFGVGDLDNIWVAVNCHNNNDMVDSHHVRFLSRFEFLESLVRIGLAKYAKKGKVDAYAAIEHLLNAHIIPHFKHMDANVFRRVKLYSESTARIFEQFRPSLKLAFKTFAITCKLGQGRSNTKLSLTRDEWVEMLNSAGVLQENGLTRRTAHGIFVFSQNSVIDEFRRSRKDSLRDDHKTMSFEETLEGMARAADAWSIGDLSFQIKLSQFLVAFCKGLKL